MVIFLSPLYLTFDSEIREVKHRGEKHQHCDVHQHAGPTMHRIKMLTKTINTVMFGQDSCEVPCGKDDNDEKECSPIQDNCNEFAAQNVWEWLLAPPSRLILLPRPP